MPYRKLSQVMKTRELLTMPPTATVRAAVRSMAARHVGTVIVTERDGHLDGIFTERDLLARVIAVGHDPDEMTLGQVMTDKPATITADDTVRDALLMMDGKAIRHLPVVDGDRVVGVVSMRDFFGEEVAVLDTQHELETQYSEHMR